MAETKESIKVQIIILKLLFFCVFLNYFIVLYMYV